MACTASRTGSAMTVTEFLLAVIAVCCVVGLLAGWGLVT